MRVEEKWSSGGLLATSSVLTPVCIAGRLEAIPESTMMEMREIREGLASLVKMSENIEELGVIGQISSISTWKAVRWTRSTASDGDIRPSNDGFKDTLMEKYFPGAERADIFCMVTGECMIAMILSSLACAIANWCLGFALNIACWSSSARGLVWAWASLCSSVCSSVCMLTNGRPVTLPPIRQYAEFAGVKTSTIAAHLMSRSKKDFALPMLAIDNIDFWRNGLLWCLPDEEAWEDSRICLTYHPVPTPGFLLHVLDDRMLNSPITADFPGMVCLALGCDKGS